MKEIKIEKGIPISERKESFPFSKMEIGDSFMVELKSTGVRDLNAIRNKLSIAKKDYVLETKNKEFNITTRKRQGGLRVWRIS